MKVPYSHLNMVMKVLLIISLLFFYIQFLSYFIFHYHLDYMQSITGSSQRLSGYMQHIGPYTLRRVSGLFGEPAVYSFVANVLLIGLIRRKALPTWLFILSIVSVWLSFSASGILISVFVFLFYLHSFTQTKQKLVFLFFIVIMIFFYHDLALLFSQQWHRIFNIMHDPSGKARLAFISFLLKKPQVIFLGYGIFTSLIDKVPPENFLVSMIYNFGIILAAIFVTFLLAFAKKSLSWSYFMIFLALGVLINYQNSSPLFWLIYSVLFVSLSDFYPQRHSFHKGRLFMMQ